MAIIEPHRCGDPPSQGDILKGVRLFVTKKSPDSGEQQSVDAKLGLCLVLSRQCVLEHKPSLIVAGIMKYSKDVSPEMTFKETVDFLETVREGVNSPDQFYLGHLPEMQGRFCARLDSLHTVELPPKPEDRQAFFDQHRIARLTIDYIRDLHIRVHQAFANMGFEDVRWLSDEDLMLVVKKGRSEIKIVEEQLSTAKLTRETAGRPTDAKQASKDQNKIDGMKKELAPFENELARRSPDRESGTSLDFAGV